MRPIVLVPGLGGSVLVQKGHETRRLFHKSVPDNRWVNIYVASQQGLRRWKKDMRGEIMYDGNGKVVSLQPEVPMHGYDFGGSKGVKDIVPEFLLLPSNYQKLLDDMFHHRYFHSIVEQMYMHGYRDHFSLFGAPYDFRFILDPIIRAEYYKQLQVLIENACSNTGEKVVLVSHSLGGIIFKSFLTTLGSQDWINRHVERWVCISAPFGGSYSALYAATSGEHYIPAMRSSVQHELQRNLGIVACFPNKLAFSDDEPLLDIEGACPVSIASYETYAGKGILPFKLWTDLFEPLYDTTLRNKVTVPTHLICASKVASTQGRGFADAWDAAPSRVEYVHGDGVVPLKSLLAIERVVDHRQLTETIMYESRNKGADCDHTSILQDETVLKIVRDYALMSYKTI